MTDGERQFAAIQRIKMKLFDAVTAQACYLLDGCAGGQHLACDRVVIKPAKTLFKPIRHAGATELRETLELRKLRNWQNAGNQFGADTSAGGTIAK